MSAVAGPMSSSRSCSYSWCQYAMAQSTQSAFSSVTKASPRCLRLSGSARCYAASASSALARKHGEEALPSPPLATKMTATSAQAARSNDRVKTELLLDILSASTTKREAKSYLSRFHPPQLIRSIPSAKSGPVKPRGRASHVGVNLGDLYIPLKSMSEENIFGQDVDPRPVIDPIQEPLHAALIVIRSPQLTDDVNLKGLARTLSQLCRLGLHSIVIVDCLEIEMNQHNLSKASRKKVLAQADRLVAAIEADGRQAARRVDGVLDLGAAGKDGTTEAPGLAFPQVLLKPMQRGVIPVLTPFGLDRCQSIVQLSAHDIALALTRGLSGTSSEKQSPPPPVSLDRIIILDRHGGIPSTAPNQESHVFINLEQEFQRIKEELHSNHQPQRIEAGRAQAHSSNLQLAHDTLRLLPHTSSALLTTVEAASHNYVDQPKSSPGVGTRRKRNLLIHNLLTDKPVYSSSLPRSRLVAQGKSATDGGPPATFFKLGMPVAILPSPAGPSGPWTPALAPPHMAALEELDIDRARLVHLIEDSFGRKLDVQGYFDRISSCLAGIIVAGEYEGCAILTWEKPLPPSSPDADADADADAGRGARSSSRLVPYLDKFAVLRRAQGAGGVADVVFSAMVRECFPCGVCWRSRSSNPVNKWYFERARGSLKMAPSAGGGGGGSGGGGGGGGEGWTMFWTTEDLDSQRRADYESVCRSVPTSWADGKKTLD